MVLASPGGSFSRLPFTWYIYAGCRGCTWDWDIALATADVFGIRTLRWLQRMYLGLGTLRWLLRVLCEGCSGCTEDGKSLAGYDTCHCLGAIYCFTAFMHFIYVCLIR